MGIKSEGFTRIIVEEQNYISKWIDSTLSVFGGEQKIFHLTTVSYKFLIVKPGYFNLPYILFCWFNQYSWFKKVFWLMILYPYFIVKIYLGSFFFYQFFCNVFLPKSILYNNNQRNIFLLFCTNTFFRFERVYQYCIDTYGAIFVKK